MAYSLSNICTKNYWNGQLLKLSLVVGWYPFLKRIVYQRSWGIRTFYLVYEGSALVRMVLGMNSLGYEQSRGQWSRMRLVYKGYE